MSIVRMLEDQTGACSSSSSSAAMTGAGAATPSSGPATATVHWHHSTSTNSSDVGVQAQYWISPSNLGKHVMHSACTAVQLHCLLQSCTQQHLCVVCAGSSKDGHPVFRYVQSSAYRSTQLAFEQCQATYDPNNVAALLQVGVLGAHAYSFAA